MHPGWGWEDQKAFFLRCSETRNGFSNWFFITTRTPKKHPKLAVKLQSFFLRRKFSKTPNSAKKSPTTKTWCVLYFYLITSSLTFFLLLITFPMFGPQTEDFFEGLQLRDFSYISEHRWPWSIPCWPTIFFKFSSICGSSWVSYWFRNALKTKQNFQLSRMFKKATLYYRLQRQFINLMHNQRRI